MTSITPAPRREHFGCETCGAIRMLPFENEEEAPYCLHTDVSGYSWLAPHPRSVREAEEHFKETGNVRHAPWRQMVRVDVAVRAVP